MESLCSLSAAFLLLLGHTLAAVAPGDEYAGCDVPHYPDNIRVLLDSWRYQTLIGQNNAVWTAVNTDERNNTWSSAGGECGDSAVTVCFGDPGEKWLMTQYINKSLPAPNEYPVRIFVNISYSFMGCPRDKCDKDFELRISHTNSERKSFTHDGIMPDRRIRDTDPSDTQQFYIDSSQSVSGYYLALKSRVMGVCVNVSRVLVYHYECPGHERQSIGLVRRPATQAPISGSVSAMAGCAENSNHTDMSIPNILVCTSDGEWLNDQTHCVCDEGYEQTVDRENCSKEMTVDTSRTVTQASTTPKTSTYMLGNATRSIMPSRMRPIPPEISTHSVKQPMPSDTATHSVKQVLSSILPTPTSKLPPKPTDKSSDNTEDDGVPVAVISAVIGVMVVIVAIALLVLLLFVARNKRTKQEKSNNQLANPVYAATEQDIELTVKSTTSNGNDSGHKQEEEILYKLYNPLYITPQNANSNDSNNPKQEDNVYFEEPQYSVPDTRRGSTIEYEVPIQSPTQPEDSTQPSHVYDYASVVPPNIAPEYAVLEPQEHTYHCLESPKKQTATPALSCEKAEIDGAGHETADGNTLDETSLQNDHTYSTVEQT